VPLDVNYQFEREAYADKQKRLLAENGQDRYSPREPIVFRPTEIGSPKAGVCPRITRITLKKIRAWQIQKNLRPFARFAGRCFVDLTL
jgi:hypothetical protein